MRLIRITADQAQAALDSAPGFATVYAVTGTELDSAVEHRELGEVTIGIDHRPARALFGFALDDGEAVASFEDWQVLGSTVKP